MTTLTPSRRQALRLAAGSALAAGAAVSTSAAPASAKTSYRPGRYAATPILDVQARHLVNRFSYGITPELAAEVRAAGGHLAWFDQQLATAYDGAADNLCDWWPDLHLDAQDLWARHSSGTRIGYRVMQDYARRVLMRRVTSRRQVLEVMTEFWENHFHVPAQVDNVFVHRTNYGEGIRAKALGRFDELLPAAVLHPAMVFYLGASISTKYHPNENLGRELLELHTLGVGNYSESDVKDSARILTGFTMDHFATWKPRYESSWHSTGPVRVLEFSDSNADADGRSVIQRYLAYLAHHPATAKRLAGKLVSAFVSDDPATELVDRLARIYLENDTAIVPVLRALVRSPEFAEAVDAKVRDPERDVVATYRLLGARVAAPTSDQSAANNIFYQVASLGLAPFMWPRPDGRPSSNQAWCSPTRVLASLSLHWSMASAVWPSVDVAFRPYSAWLPIGSTAQFGDLVDHLSRLLLHRPASQTLLRSCIEITGIPARTGLRRRSPLAASDWTRLLGAVLDSPDFYQY